MRRSFTVRSLQLAVVLAVLVALYAAVGFIVVPRVLLTQIPKRIGIATERSASLRAVEFNPFTLALQLDGFALRDRDGSALVAFDRLYADFAVSSIFRRARVLDAFHVTGLRVVARILPDGKLAVSDLIDRKSEEPAEIPRLIIRDLTLLRGRFEFVDETRTPAYRAVLDPLNVHLDDLRTVGEHGADSVLRARFDRDTEVRWDGNMSVDPFRAAGRVSVTSLDLVKLAEYLGGDAPEITAGRGDLELQYTVERTGGELRARIDQGSFVATALRMKPRGAPAETLSADSLALRGISVAYPGRRASLESFRIVNPHSQLVLEGGRTNWSTAVAEPAAATGAKSGDAGAPWSFACGSAEVSGGSFDFEDRERTPPVAIKVREATLHANGWSNGPGASAEVSAAAKIGEMGTLGVTGRYIPLLSQFDGDVALEHLDIANLAPYYADTLNVAVRAGNASLKGHVSWSPSGEPKFRYQGPASIDAFDCNDGSGVRLVSWESLRTDRGSLELVPGRLEIRRLQVRRPYVRVAIDKAANLNLANLSRMPAAPPAPIDAKATAAAEAQPPFGISVGRIEISDGLVDYSDMSLALPFVARIHSTKGTVTDVSSKSATGSPIAIEGKVEDYGYARAEGTLRLSDPFAETDVRLHFRNVDMAFLTPYAAEFAGYSIKSGRLDVDVQYLIRSRSLKGDHAVVMHDLVVGNKIGSSRGAGLAVRLAVALLKDRNGRIDMAVPVEGTVDDPQFNYKKIFWAAVRRILANAAMAPFRFLGRSLGISGEDLDRVLFEPGRADLLPPEQEKLVKLAEGLRDKPGLSLTVRGRFDHASDSRELQRMKFASLVESKRAGDEAPGTAVASREAILEALYAEQFTPAGLDAMKAKHAVPPPADTPKRKKKSDTPPQLDAKFYPELEEQLVNAQVVKPEELVELAAARARSIVTQLSGPAGLDPSRVRLMDSVPEKKKLEGNQRVSCELTMSAD